MSVMGGESVNVDFNIGGNAGSSLSQLIAQSEQYAKTSDTLLGNVGRLNMATSLLIQRTTALTGANKIATAEAAAYQQRLANIEVVARTTGQSFGQLEKMTLGLARSMPGGIGEATKYVETLQRSGVTTAKTIGKLAEDMRDLGKANGLDGAYIGKQLLTINRMFGNADDTLSKYGDTLTTLSAKYGASADGSAQFAKALAPVAAAVGMSETAVLGLGTAASRLGEDGYASANAFNRVLLDMQRSIRDGSPEIKEYAGLLGMSAKALNGLFRDDPTEVLVRFTEAVRKGGAQTSRTLDALGLDSVRTIKSIQALSSQGNLRQIIEDATGAYGSGSSAKAAEVALSGVNDQAAKLSETLSQTVAAAGKPFLGFLEGVLKAANAASGAVAGLMQSDVMQGVGKVGAVASFGGQAMGTMLTAGMTVSMLRRGGLFAREQAGLFRSGTYLAREGVELGESAGRMAAAGARYGEFMPVPLVGGGAGGPGFIRRAGRAAVLVAGGLARMTVNDMRTSGWRATSMDPNADRKIGAAFGRYLDDMKAIRADPAMYGAGEKMAMGRLTSQAIAEGTLEKGAVRGTLGRGVGMYAESAALLAGTAGRGLMAALPYAGPAALVAGAGFGAYKAVQNSNDQMEATNVGWSDAYGKFNDFAAAAGEASKGLVSFADTVTTTANTLAKQTKTVSDAFNISAAEMATASGGGYQRAFTATGETTAERAMSARLMLGTNASPSQLARVSTDLVNQYGYTSAKDVIDNLRQTQGVDPLTLVAPALQMWGENQGWAGPNAMGVESLSGLKALQTQAQGSAVSTYGSKASFVGGMGVPVEAMNAAAASGDAGQQRGAYQLLARQLGVDYDKLFLSGRTADGFMSTDALMGQNYEPIEGQTGENADFRAKMRSAQAQWRAARELGWDPSNPSNLTMMASTPEEQAAMSSRMATVGFPGSPRANRYTGAGMQNVPVTSGPGGWSMTSMIYGADIRARELGKSAGTQLTEGELEGLAESTKAINKYAQSATPENLMRAAATVAQETVARSGGSGLRAEATLKQAMAGAAPGTAFYQSMQAALGQVQMGNAPTMAGMSQADRWAAAAAAGKSAQQLMAQNPEAANDPALKADVEAAQQAEVEKVGFLKSYYKAATDVSISLKRSQEDYHKSAFRAERDFGISMAAAAQDYGKQRYRATRDFNKQMARSEEDFDVQRMRSQRDFNKAMRRTVEDAAKTLYDPYKRIEAAQTWDANSLLSNIAEQNAAMSKQTAQLAQAKRMGLSQAAIDALELADPKNAQQLNRLIEDALSDPSIVRRFNASMAQRATAAKGLVQNDSNVDYRRNLEDFKTQMSDAEKDFRKMRKRASADFHTAMSDAATDYEVQIGRAQTAHENAMSDMAKDTNTAATRMKEDLVRMGREVTLGLQGTIEGFNKSITDLPLSMRPIMSTNIRALASSANTDLKKWLDEALKPFGLSSASIVGFESIDWAKVARDAANAARQGGFRGREGVGSGSGGSDVGGGPPPEGPVGDKVDAAVKYAEKQLGKPYSYDAQPEDSWDCSKLTSWAYKQAGINLTPYTWDQMKEGSKVAVNQRRRGDLVFAMTGGNHHVGLLVGANEIIEAGSPSSGVHRSNIQNSWWSKNLSSIVRPRGLVRGGIIDKHGIYEVAEGAHNEAVIPLEASGAKTLAETMERYLDPQLVKAARVAPYSTKIVHNEFNYDQRTQITGPITVAASDPQAMARALAAKKRMDRLVNAGSRD